MAPPSGSPRPAPARGLTRFLRSACTGMVFFVLAGMLAGHGSVHVFAAGAFVAGLGWAVLCAVGRLLTRVSWRDLAGAAAVTMLLTSLAEDVRRLPGRWR